MYQLPENDRLALAQRLVSLIGVAAILALTACAGGAEQTPMIELTLDRPQGNTATVTLGDGRALIDVTDQGGINGLNVRLVEGEWPAEIVVRLRLRGLERLEIHYGDVTLATGRSSNDSPDPPLILSVVDADGRVQSASPSADIYYPDILKTDDGFDITLPPHFFRDNYPSFSMQWIDFYRN
ncbi:MAG: hypothetical protein KIS95_08530 [Anaerolineae bacterium]|uniref:hypothetical protein n=1 Tax=Promineifilum sp. TaxID=2664178 RepID=UPI001D30F0D4|nr:hypothetical protein [Anaerolineales bacterium]MCB8935499.1 hypothetical protein [Promineifilum sp.]MCO5180552.1 hypothetical protein [Promineifilum sp.]MCW5847259.1 hypothetical protein [Anaerolineae bacterium]